MIYPLFIAVVVVSYLWQLMNIVELISTGDGQIMETLNNTGIKLFVLCSASVSALQIVFSNSLCESTAK
jgi:hypothetical protein